MPFVLDASVAACWAFDNENHPLADLALSRFRLDMARAPVLLWYEIRNTFVVNERRKRIAEADTILFLSDLAKMPIVLDSASAEDTVFRLARAHRLTFYDATYLELAQREGLPLATLDSDLARAARAEGIPLLEDSTPA